MITAGIDIGSRTVKLAVLDNGSLRESRIQLNSYSPLEVCRELLQGLNYDRITATGYGRHLFAEYCSCSTVSEITAASLGSCYFLPATRSILDIGGQDMKTVSLEEAGPVRKFEMNDKCAAGTGKFLEVMAAALSYSMEDFIAAAGLAVKAQKINSMCTVFAESEVISMVAQGTPRDELALGIHQAIAGRAVFMLLKINPEPNIMFCGGVAKNSCLVDLIARELNTEIVVPPEPQLVSAVGAALYSRTLPSK